MRLWLYVALLCIYLTEYAIETSIVRDASIDDRQRVRRSEGKDPPALRKKRSGGDDHVTYHVHYDPVPVDPPPMLRVKRSDVDVQSGLKI
ncbi:Hypothetical predicted protein [Mytilus galloprovincialis]|uniref:Uncharacterized protein n=1 Tax=Mytilus galloprovincialis TaxID=29158 RepID=A0A8B6E134_MYTGA|nr:Hypothetical predicted protein [Mytilus galloprovincialis]